MKDLVEIIAKSLVDHPEQISVTETEKDDIIKVELTVAPEDMGKNCQIHPYSCKSSCFKG